MAQRDVIYDYGGVASTINGILKDHHVLNKILDLINRRTVLFSRLKTKRTTHGRKFILSIQMGTSQGVGARAENQKLPNPGWGEYEQPYGNVKYLYSTLYITGPAIESTRGNKAAYADALKQALKDCRDGLMLDMQRQVWGDGSGVIATLATKLSSDGKTIEVTNPYGLSYHEDDPLTPDQCVRLFKRNMNVVITDGANTVYSTVTAVDPSAGEITLADNVPAAMTAGAKIYRGDGAGLTNKDSELLGLSGAISATGSYLNVSRAGLPEWQSNMLDNDGAGISEEAIRASLDLTEINGTGSPDLILTDYVTRRRYEALLQSQKRFINPMNLEGGFKALEFDGLPIVVDKDAPPQRMWFLRTSDWAWYSMKDIGWLDRHGNILHPVADYDAWKAYLTTYRELVCERPNNQTVLYNIGPNVTEEAEEGSGD